MIIFIDTFKIKIELGISHINKTSLKFKDKMSWNTETCDYKQFGNILQNIFVQFQQRFVDFEKLPFY